MNRGHRRSYSSSACEWRWREAHHRVHRDHFSTASWICRRCCQVIKLRRMVNALQKSLLWHDISSRRTRDGATTTKSLEFFYFSSRKGIPGRETNSGLIEEVKVNLYSIKEKHKHNYGSVVLFLSSSASQCHDTAIKRIKKLSSTFNIIAIINWTRVLNCNFHLIINKTASQQEFYILE